MKIYFVTEAERRNVTGCKDKIMQQNRITCMILNRTMVHKTMIGICLPWAATSMPCVVMLVVDRLQSIGTNNWPRVNAYMHARHPAAHFCWTLSLDVMPCSRAPFALVVPAGAGAAWPAV